MPVAWDIVDKRIADLNPSENPRIHPPDQIQRLMASIRENGWTVPVLLDEGNYILAGHGRIEAARMLGFDSAPCIVASNWSDDEKKAYIIADNRLAETSYWDIIELRTLVGDLMKSNTSLDSLDLNIPYLADLVRKNNAIIDQIVTDASIQEAEARILGTPARSPRETITESCPECGVNIEVQMSRRIGRGIANREERERLATIAAEEAEDAAAAAAKAAAVPPISRRGTRKTIKETEKEEG